MPDWGAYFLLFPLFLCIISIFIPVAGRHYVCAHFHGIFMGNGKIEFAFPNPDAELHHTVPEQSGVLWARPDG